MEREREEDEGRLELLDLMLLLPTLLLVSSMAAAELSASGVSPLAATAAAAAARKEGERAASPGINVKDDVDWNIGLGSTSFSQ